MEQQLSQNENQLDGYYLKRKIDLKKDNQTITLVNILCVVFMIVGALIGALVIFDGFTKIELKELIKWQNFLVIGLGLFIIPPVHELLHAFVIQIMKKKVQIKFGFNGLFAYVGAKNEFRKWQYILVALAPMIIFSAIFIPLIILLPLRFYLGFYFLEVFNIGSAAGDIFIITAVINSEKDCKIVDDGLSTYIYYKKKTD